MISMVDSQALYHRTKEARWANTAHHTQHKSRFATPLRTNRLHTSTHSTEVTDLTERTGWTADEWVDEQAEFYTSIADSTAAYLLDGPGGDDDDEPSVLLVPLKHAA